MVNFDDMSKESVENAYKRKFGKNLNTFSEENDVNYCVNSFTNVEIDESAKNLIFGNGCKIHSSFDGDGVYVDERYVKNIIHDGETLFIHLKGIEEDDEAHGETIYGRDGGEL